MKIVNGIRMHTIELSDQAIATIHNLAMQGMAPYQRLLDEIAPQLPQPPKPDTKTEAERWDEHHGRYASHVDGLAPP